MILFLVGVLVGFVIGALVYRNNKAKADEIINKV
jgi:uncharacterized membrane-anchored protein YhcB (DUF1043 family)